MVKKGVQRYGGLKAYRKLHLMSLGVMLGEYGAEAIWSVVAMVGRFTTYSISINVRIEGGRGPYKKKPAVIRRACLHSSEALDIRVVGNITDFLSMLPPEFRFRRVTPRIHVRQGLRALGRFRDYAGWRD